MQQFNRPKTPLGILSFIREEPSSQEHAEAIKIEKLRLQVRILSKLKAKPSSSRSQTVFSKAEKLARILSANATDNEIENYCETVRKNTGSKPKTSNVREKLRMYEVIPASIRDLIRKRIFNAEEIKSIVHQLQNGTITEVDILKEALSKLTKNK